MDAKYFDTLTRALSEASPRRGLLGLLATLPLLGGLFALLDFDETDAKGRRKRRKKAHKHGKGRHKENRKGKGKKKQKAKCATEGQVPQSGKSCCADLVLDAGDRCVAPSPPPPPGCEPGFHRCGETCVSDDDPATCGTRCAPCPASPCSPATCDGATCGRAPIAGCCESNNECGDDNVCTTDTCDPVTRTCVHDVAPPETPCGSGEAGLCCGGACCEAPEHALPTCSGATCGFACVAGFHRCGEICVSNDAIEHCGARCEPCPEPDHSSASCDSGICSFTCDAGYHLCSGDMTACYADDDPARCGPGCAVCTECETCNGTTCVAVSNDTPCSTGHCCNGVCPPDPCPANATCGTALDACGRVVSCGNTCSNPTPICESNVCTACSATTPCPAGFVCHEGSCQACTVTCLASDHVCSGATLQNAMAAGGTVYVCPGRYTGSFAPGNATVIGAGDGDNPASNTILDALRNGRVMSVANTSSVALHGIRLTGGSVGGGGAMLNDGTVTMTACTIYLNRSSSFGGGLYNRGTATLTGCTISGNISSAPGGGIYQSSSNALTLVNCTVAENTSSGGGGIYQNNGGVHLTNVTFNTNSPNNCAGGITCP